LSDEVAAYLLHHYPRSMVELLQALETLDYETLRAKRRLTVPFAKRVLSQT
jgi:DnaA-homolog protein